MMIYKITNLLSGKIYIGQTQRDLKERFDEHARHHETYISKAIQKYGKENFSIEVIEECDNIEQLNEREKFWISKLKCKVPNGYNLTDGGEGSCGRTPTLETRLKQSESVKARWKDPKKREKATKANRERWKDPAYHQKMSEIQKKRCLEKPDTEETKAKKSAAHKGKKHSAETRAKISAAHKGKKFTA